MEKEFVDIDAILLLKQMAKHPESKIDLDFELFETKEYTGRKR